MTATGFAACSSQEDRPPVSAGEDYDSGNDAATTDDAGIDSAATPAETAAFNQLLGDAQNFMTAGATPGVSIAIVLHGKLTFASGVGQRNRTTGDAVTTSTLFRAASMSKMIAAATAMTLVDEDKLDLNAPITTYLPWFQLASGFDATKLTMNLLLSHSSGFPCDTISQCGTPATTVSRKTFFQNNPQPLWAPPGAIYDYSNTGFALAATTIEAAAGGNDGDYETLAHDRVLAPVGMTTATFDANAATATDHATGYDVDANGNVTATIEPSQLDCPLLNPPGGIEATATDYAHFAEMLLANGGSVLKPASVAAMETAHADMHTFASQNYGYALIDQFSPYPDHTSIWHDGSLPGFLSLIWLVPDDQFAIVVLANAQSAQGVPDQIVGDALGLFISETRKVPPLTTPPASWTGYVGTYDDTHGTLGSGVVVSQEADGGLIVNAPNATDYSGNPAAVSGSMIQNAGDSWLMPDGTNAGFFPGADGGTGYFVTRRGVGIRE